MSGRHEYLRSPGIGSRDSTRRSGHCNVVRTGFLTQNLSGQPGALDKNRPPTKGQREYRAVVRATVRDVARLAGVSPKTVSNVVNGRVPGSRETRLKVERALDALNYVPNLSARGLRNGRTGGIALALPDLSTPYSAIMAHHIVRAAADRGWSVQIEETGRGGSRREAELLSKARAHLVDGLILSPVRLETSALQRGISLPPVVVLGEVDQPVVDCVWIDNTAAARSI